MSSKRAKLALKNAKQAIQTKDFETALKHCQDVLEEDSVNYNGLVFAGLCQSELKHHELALASYNQACKAQPENALAYQGIVNLFSKHNMKGNAEQISTLISAYQFLINQTKLEPSKRLELLNGLAHAHCTNKQLDLAFKSLESAVQELQENPSISKIVTQQSILQCLKHSVHAYDQLQVEPQTIYTEMCELVQNEEASQSDREESLKYLLSFLQSKQGCLEKYLKDLNVLCRKLVGQNKNSTIFADVAVQTILQEETFFDQSDDIAHILEACKSPYKLIHQAYCLFSQNKLEKCHSLLQEGLQNASDFVPGWLLLCRCLNNLHRGTAAEKAAKSGLQECKKLASPRPQTWIVCIQPLDKLKLDLTQCLASALALQHNPTSLNLAKSTYTKLSKVEAYSVQANLGLIEVEAKLRNWDGVREILAENQSLADEPNAKCWQALLQFKDGDKENAINSLQSLLKQHPKHFLATLTLGKLMWESGQSYRRDKSQCLATFLKAAKMDVYNGETFLYLGHYYSEVAGDKVRAKKCYQKAYALDEGSEAAGSALADIYVAEGNFDDAVALYEGVTRVAVPGTCKWAWLRLGLCRLKMKDGNGAIKCFLAALRADANDYICWECLGEGYVGRGSYGAAWKAFNKAHELNPKSVYSVYQMATVKQILGQHVEAISEYSDVLDMVPDYVPALKGLGESHLATARQMLTEGRDPTACDHVVEAMRHLTSAVSSSGNMSCLWKLLGDACSVLHVLHPSQVNVDVPTVLCPHVGDGHDSVKLDKEQLLGLGTKCYSRAISLHDSLSSLWHELGMNLFYRAKEAADLSVATELAEKSQNTLQKAISLEPHNHVLWNDLGVVAASKYIENWALAQHAFIKSIEADANNCWAWSNLGSMYLLQSQVQLAHQAFKVAQSLEPSFPNSWIGQALVAESIGSEEAMDLFRHATELGLHGQSGTGYASWVARLVTECQDRTAQRYRENIHDMNAIPAALTQLHKYCNRHPDSAWAVTLHGFMLEQSGLNRSAEEAYRQAAKLVKRELDAEEGERTALARRLDEANVNYARILCVNGKHSEAVEIFRSLENLDFHNSCGLALALRQSGKYKEAMKVYEECGRMVATEDSRAGVAVASATLYFQQKDYARARETLAPWIKSSLHAKRTLAAMEILRAEDVTTLPDLAASSRDIAFRHCLLAVASLLRHDPTAACHVVQKCIHRYPFDWRFRNLLSQLIQVRAAEVPIGLGHVMAESGLLCYVTDVACSSINRDLLRRSGTDCSTEHRLASTVNATSLLSSGQHGYDPGTKRSGHSALKSAQRLIHCHPYKVESWSVLSACCYAHSVCSKLVGKAGHLDTTCRRICDFVEENSHSSGLKRWSTIQKILSLISSEEFDEVAKLAEQISDDFEETDFYLTLCDCAKELKATGVVNKSLIGELRSLASSKSASLRRKTAAAHVLHCAGLHKEAHDLLSSAAGPNKTNECLKTALHRFAVAFSVAQSASDPDQRCTWVGLCGEAVNAAKAEETNDVTMLAEGLCRYLEKNHRKCRVALNRLLDSGRPPQGGELCIGRGAAAWYLYRQLHERNDAMEIEKFLDKWIEDPFVQRIMKLLPLQ